jgi:hypothetical protein
MPNHSLVQIGSNPTRTRPPAHHERSTTGSHAPRSDFLFFQVPGREPVLYDTYGVQDQEKAAFCASMAPRGWERKGRTGAPPGTRADGCTRCCCACPNARTVLAGAAACLERGQVVCLNPRIRLHCTGFLPAPLLAPHGHFAAVMTTSSALRGSVSSRTFISSLRASHPLVRGTP